MIFLDMDGVIFDFCKAAFAAHKFDPIAFPERNEDGDLDYCISKLMGLNNAQFWKKIDDLGYKFWADLEAYDYFDDLIGTVLDFDDFRLLTAPSNSDDCEKGKKICIKRHFGKSFKNYIFTPKENKQLLGYVPGAVLIDDNPKNCEQFKEVGGQVILFPESANKNRHITDKVEYVRQELDRIYSKS